MKTDKAKLTVNLSEKTDKNYYICIYFQSLLSHPPPSLLPHLLYTFCSKVFEAVASVGHYLICGTFNVITFLIKVIFCAGGIHQGESQEQ